MKKLLMTIAVFGAAAAAHAQEEPKKPSIVCVEGKCNEPVPEASKEPGERFLENLKFEVYGIADIAFLYRDNIAVNGKDSKAGVQNYLTLISGGRNQSRIGLRGFYKLGPKARAVMEVEKGINYMDGTIEDGKDGDPIQFFNRRAAIGLEQDGIGRLTVGRQLTPAYDFLLIIDPMNYSPTFSWIPTAGSGDPATFKANAGRYSTRVDRTIKYAGRFGGLQILAYYALGDSLSAIANNSRFGGGAMYTTGDLTGLFVYDQRNLSMTPAGLPKEQMGSFWLRYKLLDGLLTPTVGVRRYVADSRNVSDTLWIMGVQIRPTKELTFVIADYFDKKTDGTGQDDNLLVLRANYALGKIVELYMTFGHASAANGGLAGVMRANDAAPVADSQNGLSLGLRIRYGYPPAGE
jgi:predicted porin